MSSLSQWVYEPAAVRELDRIAIEEQGIPGYELMNRAGAFAFDCIRERWPARRHWSVWCGGGNNAGDGYVIARLARDAGITVDVVAVSDPAGLTGDAARAHGEYAATGGRVGRAFTFSPTATLVVDSLLGTGLQRPLEGDYARAVAAINEAALPVAAIDVPTGLHGATGAVLGSCVAADLTVTFVGLKLGLFIGDGPAHSGPVRYSDLDIRPVPVSRVAPVMRCMTASRARRLLPRRNQDAHKGDFGHVLVIGGNAGMGGAVRLAGEAALRAGAGLVSVVTRPAHVGPLLAGRPELMVRGAESATDLDAALLARADVIAVGPGLGTDDWATGLLARVLDSGKALVLDADALNVLAARPQRRDDWILTPHPGEAGRLLGSNAAAVQADRPGALAALQARYGGAVILKGAGALSGDGSGLPWLNRPGNPGMASAGMGDVLTGVVAAVRAQCPAAPAAEVAALAAWLHATAGDLAAAAGERGLIASDVCEELRKCLN